MNLFIFYRSNKLKMSRRSSVMKDEWVLVVYFETTKMGKQIEEDAVVPVHWLSNGRTKMWWPDNKIIENKINLIPSCEGWSAYTVKKIKYSG